MDASKPDLILYLVDYKYGRDKDKDFPPFDVWLVSAKNRKLSNEEMKYKRDLERMEWWEVEKLYEKAELAEEFYRGQREKLRESRVDARSSAEETISLKSRPAAEIDSSNALPTPLGEDPVSRGELLRLEDELHRLREQYEKVREENATLRSELESLKTGAGTEKPLGTLQRKTLLKIILGVALEQYGFDPKKTRNTAAKQMSDDLRQHGLDVTDETINDRLRDAVNELLR